MRELGDPLPSPQHSRRPQPVLSAHGRPRREPPGIVVLVVASVVVVPEAKSQMSRVKTRTIRR